MKISSKFQKINSNMKNNNGNNSKYDLSDRCLSFAKNTRDFVKKIKQTVANREYERQLVRSSSAVGANYIEANDSLGRKDFVMHMRISRKESKESRYWFSLLEVSGDLEKERDGLLREASELTKIFSSILIKF